MTQKAVSNFITQTIKNFKTMKSKISKIWLVTFIMAIGCIIQSCNVTRVITNESQYFQKGDTAVTIQTKTIETYNATKNY